MSQVNIQDVPIGEYVMIRDTLFQVVTRIEGYTELKNVEYNSYMVLAPNGKVIPCDVPKLRSLEETVRD